MFYALTTLFAFAGFWAYYGEKILYFYFELGGKCPHDSAWICYEILEARYIFVAMVVMFSYVNYCVFMIGRKPGLLSVPIYFMAFLLLIVDCYIFYILTMGIFQEMSGDSQSSYGDKDWMWQLVGIVLLNFLRMPYFELPGWCIVYRDGRRLWLRLRGPVST